MYYQEKYENGVLYCRYAPNGEWLPVNISTLSRRVVESENKNKLLTEALEGMKRLNLHLYEEGTVGNMCYKEMIEALNKTKN